MASMFRPTRGFTQKPNAMIRLVAALSLILAVTISTLSSSATAGTETGEFCPTCPDWTNLDGWLSQKAAYEESHQTGPYAGTSSINTNNINTNINSKNPTRSYPVQSAITSVGNSMNGYVLLDVRSSEDFRQGHIPGSRNIYWRSIEPNDTLDVATAENALREAGINNTDKILIYGGTDEGASFMFWAMSYLGHKSLSRLDGGAAAAWQANIKPEKNYALVKRSNYTIHAIPEMLVNDSNLNGSLKMPRIQILDARDFTDYGKSKLTATALQFQVDTLYNKDKKIKDPATLENMLSSRGLNRNSLLLVYGTPKAYDLCYGLKLMGYNATLLEGDWWQKTEWAVSSVK